MAAEKQLPTGAVESPRLQVAGSADDFPVGMPAELFGDGG